MQQIQMLSNPIGDGGSGELEKKSKKGGMKYHESNHASIRHSILYLGDSPVKGVSGVERKKKSYGEEGNKTE